MDEQPQSTTRKALINGALVLLTLGVAYMLWFDEPKPQRRRRRVVA